jgi:hypothetical protein
MTGQHSGRRGCFYTQEGYIADVLQVVGEVNKSGQQSNAGGPYGDRHWRRKASVQRSNNKGEGVVSGIEVYRRGRSSESVREGVYETRGGN